MRTLTLASAVTASALAAGAVCALHPAGALLLVAAALAAALIFTSAFRAMLAFLVVLVSRPADLVPALELLKPAKVLALAGLALWLLGKLLRADKRVSHAPSGKWMFLLAVAVLLSALTGSSRADSMAMFTDSFVKILIIYVLIVHLVDSPARAVTFHVVMSACTSGLALYALSTKLSGGATVEGNRAGFVGLLGDPNDLALVLLMYVPFLIEAVLATRGLRRAGLACLLVVLLAGLVSTLSRGGMLGLALALVVTFHDRGSLPLRLAAIPVAGAALVAVALLAGVNDRKSGAISGEELDESAQGRLDAWSAGGRMLRAHPLLGVGFGRFADNFESYARDAVIWGKHETHNSYIKVAAETGLAGLVPFAALVVISVRTGHRLRKLPQREAGLHSAARRALLPGVAGFCVAAFFLSQCWSWFFYILFAQAAALSELDA